MRETSPQARVRHEAEIGIRDAQGSRRDHRRGRVNDLSRDQPRRTWCWFHQSTKLLRRADVDAITSGQSAAPVRKQKPK